MSEYQQGQVVLAPPKPDHDQFGAMDVRAAKKTERLLRYYAHMMQVDPQNQKMWAERAQAVIEEQETAAGERQTAIEQQPDPEAPIRQKIVSLLNDEQRRKLEAAKTPEETINALNRAAAERFSTYADTGNATAKREAAAISGLAKSLSEHAPLAEAIRERSGMIERYETRVEAGGKMVIGQVWKRAQAVWEGLGGVGTLIRGRGGEGVERLAMSIEKLGLGFTHDDIDQLITGKKPTSAASKPTTLFKELLPNAPWWVTTPLDLAAVVAVMKGVKAIDVRVGLKGAQRRAILESAKKAEALMIKGGVNKYEAARASKSMAVLAAESRNAGLTEQQFQNLVKTQAPVVAEMGLQADAVAKEMFPGTFARLKLHNFGQWVKRTLRAAVTGQKRHPMDARAALAGSANAPSGDEMKQVLAGLGKTPGEVAKALKNDKDLLASVVGFVARQGTSGIPVLEELSRTKGFGQAVEKARTALGPEGEGGEAQPPAPAEAEAPAVPVEAAPAAELPAEAAAGEPPTPPTAPPEAGVPGAEGQPSADEILAEHMVGPLKKSTKQIIDRTIGRRTEGQIEVASDLIRYAAGYKEGEWIGEVVGTKTGRAEGMARGRAKAEAKAIKAIARERESTVRKLAKAFKAGGEEAAEARRDLRFLAETMLPRGDLDRILPVLDRIERPADGAAAFLSLLRVKEKVDVLAARSALRETITEVRERMRKMSDADRSILLGRLEGVAKTKPTQQSVAWAREILDHAARLEAEDPDAFYVPSGIIDKARSILDRQGKTAITDMDLDSLRDLNSGLWAAVDAIDMRHGIIDKRAAAARQKQGEALVAAAPHGKHGAELDPRLATPAARRGLIRQTAHEFGTDMFGQMVRVFGDTDELQAAFRGRAQQGTRESIEAFSEWHDQFTKTSRQLFGTEKRVHQLLDEKRNLTLPDAGEVRGVTEAQVARWVAMCEDGDTLAKLMRNRDEGVTLSGVKERGPVKFTVRDIRAMREWLSPDMRDALDAYVELLNGPVRDFVNPEAVKARGYEAIHAGEEWPRYYPRRVMPKTSGTIGTRGTRDTPEFLEPRRRTTAPLDGSGNIFSDLLRQMKKASEMPKVRAAKDLWQQFNEPAVRERVLERLGTDGSRQFYRDLKDYCNAYSGLVIDRPHPGENVVLRMMHRGLLLWNASTMLNVGVSAIAGPAEGVALASILDPRNFSAQMQRDVQAVIDSEPILRARLGLSGHEILTPGTTPQDLAKQVMGAEPSSWTPSGSLQPADRTAVLSQIAGAIRQEQELGLPAEEALDLAREQALRLIERTQAGTDPAFYPLALLPGRVTGVKRVLLAFQNETSKRFFGLSRGISEGRRTGNWGQAARYAQTIVLEAAMTAATGLVAAWLYKKIGSAIYNLIRKRRKDETPVVPYPAKDKGWKLYLRRALRNMVGIVPAFGDAVGSLAESVYNSMAGEEGRGPGPPQTPLGAAADNMGEAWEGIFGAVKKEIHDDLPAEKRSAMWARVAIQSLRALRYAGVPAGTIGRIAQEALRPATLKRTDHYDMLQDATEKGDEKRARYANRKLAEDGASDDLILKTMRNRQVRELRTAAMVGDMGRGRRAVEMLKKMGLSDAEIDALLRAELSKRLRQAVKERDEKAAGRAKELLNKGK